MECSGAVRSEAGWLPEGSLGPATSYAPPTPGAPWPGVKEPAGMIVLGPEATGSSRVRVAEWVLRSGLTLWYRLAR